MKEYVEQIVKLEELKQTFYKDNFKIKIQGRFYIIMFTNTNVVFSI